MNSVNGKVALISGGARLHAKGASLVLTDLDEAPLKELAAELGAAGPATSHSSKDRVLTVLADVRDLAAMQAAADQAVEHFGGIDIVLANAGIAGYGSVLQVDPDPFKLLIDVNRGRRVQHRACGAARRDRPPWLRADRFVARRLRRRARPGALQLLQGRGGAVRERAATGGRAPRGGRRIAHMSGIDTPLVRDTKEDRPTFRELLASLPSPLNKTTTVDKCGGAFVKGIEGRKRQLNCPGRVGAKRWLRPVLSTRLGEGPIRKFVPDPLPRMGAEVAALGRSMGARTEAVEKRSAR